MGGHCDTNASIMKMDLEDNGRGIPVGIHKKEGVQHEVV
jgi:DNA gyrase subunit B